MTLGRVFNVLGHAIDGKGLGRHASMACRSTGPPRPSTSRPPTTEVFETGIKVIDLICPFTKGGKIGIFGGAGVGKTVIIQELIRNVAAGARRRTRSSPGSASGRARATTCSTR